MSPPPDRPKIYHILHVDKLPSVIADGELLCDAEIVQRGSAGTTIGMGSIKQRRLVLPIDCHPGDRVGDYVPFYFCPRSIMLYVIHRANHPELTYRGGQEPIVHLEADLRAVVSWATAQHRRWAFSLSNAGAHYTQFRSHLDDLGQIDWHAVTATDFRTADVKEGKQAEFLVHQSLPWELVERVGVLSPEVAQRAANAIHGAVHRPRIEVHRDWYY
jgi:hypothetical protein